jgi:hypothetical protein
MPCPCRAHAVPLPCSDSAVSFVKVRVVAGNTRTATLFCSVLLPLFTVVGMDRCEGEWYVSDKLRGTPRGSRKKPNAGTGRLSTVVLCRGLEKNGMVRAWHGRGMESVNQTRPHFINQMGKTHSKPSAPWHGMGTAWARHAMCESALILLYTLLTWTAKTLPSLCEFQCVFLLSSDEGVAKSRKET